MSDHQENLSEERIVPWTYQEWTDYAYRYQQKWIPLRISQSMAQIRLGRYHRITNYDNHSGSDHGTAMEKDAKLLLWLAKTAGNADELWNWLATVSAPLPDPAVDFVHRMLPSGTHRAARQPGRPRAWPQVLLLSDGLMRATLYYKNSVCDWWSVALFDELAIVAESDSPSPKPMKNCLLLLKELIDDNDWGPASQPAYDLFVHTADAITNMIRGADPASQLRTALEKLELLLELHIAKAFEHLLGASGPDGDLELSRLEAGERRWLALRQKGS